MIKENKYEIIRDYDNLQRVKRITLVENDSYVYGVNVYYDINNIHLTSDRILQDLATYTKLLNIALNDIKIASNDNERINALNKIEYSQIILNICSEILNLYR